MSDLGNTRVLGKLTTFQRITIGNGESLSTVDLGDGPDQIATNSQLQEGTIRMGAVNARHFVYRHLGAFDYAAGKLVVLSRADSDAVFCDGTLTGYRASGAHSHFHLNVNAAGAGTLNRWTLAGTAIAGAGATATTIKKVQIDYDGVSYIAVQIGPDTNIAPNGGLYFNGLLIDDEHSFEVLDASDLPPNVTIIDEENIATGSHFMGRPGDEMDYQTLQRLGGVIPETDYDNIWAGVNTFNGAVNIAALLTLTAGLTVDAGEAAFASHVTVSGNLTAQSTAYLESSLYGQQAALRDDGNFEWTIGNTVGETGGGYGASGFRVKDSGVTAGWYLDALQLTSGWEFITHEAGANPLTALTIDPSGAIHGAGVGFAPENYSVNFRYLYENSIRVLTDSDVSSNGGALATLSNLENYGLLNNGTAVVDRTTVPRTQGFFSLSGTEPIVIGRSSTDENFLFGVRVADAATPSAVFVDWTSGGVWKGEINLAFEADLTAVEDRVTTNESDISTLQGQRSSLRTDLTTAENDIVSLEGRVSTNETDIATLQGNVGTLQTEMDTAQTDITNLEGRATTNESDIATLQGNVDTLQTNVSSNDSDISTLQTNVASNDSDISTLQTDLTNLTGRVSTNETNIGTLQTDVDAIETDLSTFGLVDEATTIIGTSSVSMPQGFFALSGSKPVIVGRSSTNQNFMFGVDVADAAFPTSVFVNWTSGGAWKGPINLAFEADLTTLAGRVTTNESDISTLQTNVGSNDGDIAALQTDLGNLDTRVGTNETDIANLQATVATETWVTDNFSQLGHTHAAADVISGTFADARIAQSSVTQHAGALTWTNLGIAKTDVSKDDVGLSNLTNDQQVPKSGGTFTGDVDFTGTKISGSGSQLTQLDGFLAVPKGYAMPDGLEFRFDTSQTAYIFDESSSATITINRGSDPGTGALKQRFEYTNGYINLNDFKDVNGDFEFEVTGIDLSNSSNSNWRPYLLFHSNGEKVGTVIIEFLEGDGTTWTEVYNGPGEDIIAPRGYTNFTTGRLQGMRFIFLNISNNAYFKMTGATSRTSESFAWQMLKSGGDFFGDIGGRQSGNQTWLVTKSGWAEFNNVKDSGFRVFSPNNEPDFTDITGTVANAQVPQSSVTQHEASITVTESQISDLQTYELLSNKGANSGYAPLNSNGIIPDQHMPSLALTEVYVVADIAERDALDALAGDIAIVQDATADPEIDNGGATYIRSSSDWKRTLSPTDLVTSVNGQIGDVVLNLSHVGSYGSGLSLGSNTLSIDDSYFGTMAFEAAGDYSLTTHTHAFSELTGSIGDAQVPQSAITQHGAALNWTNLGIAKTDVSAADVGLDDIPGRVSTNETDISNLDGRITTNEGDIATLQNQSATETWVDDNYVSYNDLGNYRIEHNVDANSLDFKYVG